MVRHPICIEVGHELKKKRDRYVECVSTIRSCGFEMFEAADEKWLA